MSRARPRRDDSGWFFVGYAGIAGFLLIEALVRERGTASSLETSREDKGTTRLIGAAYLAVAAIAPALRRLRVPKLPRVAGPIGLSLQVAGLGLRIWSMQTLRTSYSRTLRTADDQQLVDDGPYRLVRHPGYLGSLLTWTGFALESLSAPVVATVGFLFAVYVRRIEAEEELLLRDLPGYRDYSLRTSRLIPFVW
ncbi:MAG: methyltransferase family protein [Acidimicrobiales bacterium]